ncbi:hypothetical protein ACJMK2_035782 [Sinanodonta woodiana]|uniref:Uncharacterized protein n=1 Tax=Sinanodonta woodiana TaxID=1069815 RepID=A0ABD3WF46_SINWO
METEYSLYYEEPSHLYRHLLMESDNETALILNMSFSPASSTSTTGGTDASMATADGSDACTQTDEHNSCPFSNLKCEEEEEEEFEYEDDRDDDEYVPKSRSNKKVLFETCNVEMPLNII